MNSSSLDRLPLFLFLFAEMNLYRVRYGFHLMSGISELGLVAAFSEACSVEVSGEVRDYWISDVASHLKPVCCRITQIASTTFSRGRICGASHAGLNCAVLYSFRHHDASQTC